MKHIKQNDKRLYPIIQKIGCFFVSCAIVAQNTAGKDLTASQINAVWDWAKKTKRVDQNDNITDSASIINRFLRVLGSAGRFIEVGTFRDGRTQFYPLVNEKYRHVDALIQKIKQGGKSVTHFRVVDRKGTLIEDPHEPPIKALSVYYSILYCFIKEEK